MKPPETISRNEDRAHIKIWQIQNKIALPTKIIQLEFVKRWYHEGML